LANDLLVRAIDPAHKRDHQLKTNSDAPPIAPNNRQKYKFNTLIAAADKSKFRTPRDDSEASCATLKLIATQQRIIRKRK
jgi:hypothetical protein